MDYRDLETDELCDTYPGSYDSLVITWQVNEYRLYRSLSGKVEHCVAPYAVASFESSA